MVLRFHVVCGMYVASVLAGYYFRPSLLEALMCAQTRNKVGASRRFAWIPTDFDGGLRSGAPGLRRGPGAWGRLSGLVWGVALVVATTFSQLAMAGEVRLFFERDTDGQAGNELAIVSYASLADFVGNTSSVTQFTQIDIDPNFSIGGVTYDSSAYRVLFERNSDGQAGNELAVVSFATLADLIGNTASVTQFSQIDVDPSFSVRGFAFDSGLDLYRLLFERDSDGQAGNELAFVSFASLANLIGNTASVTQFTQIDVDPIYSVAGLIIEPDPASNPVDEPGTLALVVTVLTLWAWRWQAQRPVRTARGKRRLD
jgi:hypothetical protein